MFTANWKVCFLNWSKVQVLLLSEPQVSLLLRSFFSSFKTWTTCLGTSDIYSRFLTQSFQVSIIESGSSVCDFKWLSIICPAFCIDSMIQSWNESPNMYALWTHIYCNLSPIRKPCGPIILVRTHFRPSRTCTKKCWTSRERTVFINFTLKWLQDILTNSEINPYYNRYVYSSFAYYLSLLSVENPSHTIRSRTWTTSHLFVVLALLHDFEYFSVLYLLLAFIFLPFLTFGELN